MIPARRTKNNASLRNGWGFSYDLDLCNVTVEVSPITGDIKLLIGKYAQKTFKNINYPIDTRGGFDKMMTR